MFYPSSWHKALHVFLYAWKAAFSSALYQLISTGTGFHYALSSNSLWVNSGYLKEIIPAVSWLQLGAVGLSCYCGPYVVDLLLRSTYWLSHWPEVSLDSCWGPSFGDTGFWTKSGQHGLWPLGLILSPLVVDLLLGCPLADLLLWPQARGDPDIFIVYRHEEMCMSIPQSAKEYGNRVGIYWFIPLELYEFSWSNTRKLLHLLRLNIAYSFLVLKCLISSLCTSVMVILYY